MSKVYSAQFDRDFKWYLSMRNAFSFDGSSHYIDKNGNPLIVYDPKGASSKEAFFYLDSKGIVKPTKHPTTLEALLRTKGSANLHIKMYAEDRASGNMGKIELRALCIQMKAPDWFRNAIETQKWEHVNIPSREKKQFAVFDIKQRGKVIAQASIGIPNHARIKKGFLSTYRPLVIKEFKKTQMIESSTISATFVKIIEELSA